MQHGGCSDFAISIYIRYQKLNDQFSDMAIVDEPYRLAFLWSDYEIVNKFKRKQWVMTNK